MRAKKRNPFLYCALLSAPLISAGKTAYAADSIAHQISLPAGKTWCEDSLINGLFDQINALRSQNGVPALKLDAVGMKDAEMRADQFSTYMTTNPPGTPGFNPHQGYDTTAASLGYNIISENLAFMSTDPYYIVYSIWQDRLHLAAMLASDANVAGVSCVYYNGTPYWTYEPGYSANPTPLPPGGATLDSEQWAFLTLINNYRAQNGAGPLQVSATLQAASQWMSADMANKNYASHTDSLGRSPGARLAAFGYTYSPWGENIAGGYPGAQSTFNQWQSACDPDATGTCTYAHRKNMLGPSFRAIGIGRAYNANSSYGWYWTTDFGGYVDQVISPNPVPPGPPPVVLSFIASPSTIVAGQSAALSWSVAGATSISIDQGVGDVSSLTFRPVSPFQTTAYTLTASNGAGSATARVTVTVAAATDSQPPTAPTIVSAVAKGPTEVDLVWSSSSDNVAVAGYQILRNGSVLTSVSGAVLSYADIGASPNSVYTYIVKAYDAAGNYSATSNSMQATTPPLPAPGTCPPAASGAFTGCYYNNLTLTGSPALVRTDTQINFGWSSGSPDRSVSPFNFSARWLGNFNFDQGDYTFTAIASDGIRLYIDGNNVLDRWRDQPAYSYTVRLTLGQGAHLVGVDYYTHTGTPIVHVSWQRSSPAVQAPVISFFNATPSVINRGNAATLSWSVTGATAVSIDNGVGDVSGLTSRSVSPAQTTTYRLTATNAAESASAAATVTVNAPADTQPPTAPATVSAAVKGPTAVGLVWTASTDNVGVAGYQVLRNGALLTSVPATSLSYSDNAATPNSTYAYGVRAYDAAGNVSAASNSAPVTTPAAPAGGACPGPATGAFSGCYYANVSLAGDPVFIRTDRQINFDWWIGTGSPDSSLSPAGFSARWQGNFNFEQGDYSFTAVGSDGMRVYIDGVPVLERWRDQSPYVSVIGQRLTAGNHLIAVEYYHRTNLAMVHLSWWKN